MRATQCLSVKPISKMTVDGEHHIQYPTDSHTNDDMTVNYIDPPLIVATPKSTSSVPCRHRSSNLNQVFFILENRFGLLFPFGA